MANPAIRTRPSPVTPAGTGKTPWRATLEAGARLLQDTTPLKDFDVYVAGLHCARHDPGMQMEAHHYCRQVNEDLLQCVIFDGNTRAANLIGLEYIVSERLFETLPEQERGFWHPHNYEVLSGQLVAPGLPEVAERAFMRLLLNSYGKTWHTWHTGRHDQPAGGERLPTGEAMLMWSFNRDGEADAALKADFQAGMGIEEAGRREKRAGLAEHAHPQEGVDAMAGAFTGTTPVRGVVDKSARSTG
jgi:Protein of unknown function (DUF1264)